MPAGSKKRKVTAYLDPAVVRATKVRAARTDKRDSEVIEEALRAHLGMQALAEAQAMSTLSWEEALELANAELHAMRAEDPPIPVPSPRTFADRLDA